jgi:hypothetical protein
MNEAKRLKQLQLQLRAQGLSSGEIFFCTQDFFSLLARRLLFFSFSDAHTNKTKQTDSHASAGNRVGLFSASFYVLDSKYTTASIGFGNLCLEKD